MLSASKSTIVCGLALAMCWPLTAAAQVNLPPGYEVCKFKGLGFDYPVRMNNRGQFVFTRRPYPDDPYSQEIYLYDHGRLTRLTHDATTPVPDYAPDINDAGVIVWSRRIGPQLPYGPAAEIVMWRDGVLTQLTDDAYDHEGVRINRAGHLVWYKWIGGGCDDANCAIEFWDGQTIRTICEPDRSNQGPLINDDDWVTWTAYSFCDEPYWTSKICVYVQGRTIEIDPGGVYHEGGVSSLTNQGRIAFDFASGPGQHAIKFWEDGQTTIFTDDGTGARLNSRGDVLFARENDAQTTGVLWLYSSGRYYQLTDYPDWFWPVIGDLNESGEAVWSAGRVIDLRADVRYLRRIPPGNRGMGDLVEPEAVSPITPP
jgi:hypothetical protein